MHDNAFFNLTVFRTFFFKVFTNIILPSFICFFIFVKHIVNEEIQSWCALDFFCINLGFCCFDRWVSMFDGLWDNTFCS